MKRRNSVKNFKRWLDQQIYPCLVTDKNCIIIDGNDKINVIVKKGDNLTEYIRLPANLLKKQMLLKKCIKAVTHYHCGLFFIEGNPVTEHVPLDSNYYYYWSLVPTFNSHLESFVEQLPTPAGIFDLTKLFSYISFDQLCPDLIQNMNAIIPEQVIDYVHFMQPIHFNSQLLNFLGFDSIKNYQLGVGNIITTASIPPIFNVVYNLLNPDPSKVVKNIVIPFRPHRELETRYGSLTFNEIDNEMKIFMAIFEDVTAIQKEQKEQKFNDQLLHAIIECQQIASTNLNIRDISERLLTLLLKMTSSRYGYICENRTTYSGDLFLHCNAISDLSWNEQTREFYIKGKPNGWDFPIDKNNPTLFGLCAINQKYIIANDIQNDPRLKNNPGCCVFPIDMKKFMAIPLITNNGKLIGQVGIGDADGDYSEEQIFLLRPFLDTIVTIITNYNYNYEQTKIRTVLTGIKNIQKSYIENSDYINFINSICNNLNGILGCDGSLFVEYYNEIFTCRSSLSKNYDSLFEKWSASLNSEQFGIINDKLGTKKTYLYTDNVENIPFLKNLKCPLLSIVIFPVIHKGAVLGYLIAGNLNTPIEHQTIDIVHSFIVNCAGFISAFHMSKELTKIQREKLIALEELNKAKDLFLANMSHEIRTPLNGIVSMSELLMTSKTLSVADLDKIEIIGACSEQLKNITDDILDYSKIIAGKMHILPKSVSVHEICKTALSAVYIRAQQKNLKTRMFIHPDTPQLIIADKNRLLQILNNLLTNAIKFTNEGSINLLANISEDKQMVCITIRDTGIGMRENDIDKIFEYFTQLDNGLPNNNGTGLGLAIVAKLVNLMNGKIHVESKFGEGSQFIVSLPIAYDTDTLQLSPRLSPKKNIDLSDIKWNILVADDIDVNITIVQNLLAHFKFDTNLIDVCSNGRDAVNLAKNKKYDVIFMDLKMPVMDGITACKKIFADSCCGNPVIIAMSANVLPTAKQQFMSTGVQNFLDKPITLSSISQIIEELFKKFQIVK